MADEFDLEGVLVLDEEELFADELFVMLEEEPSVVKQAPPQAKKVQQEEPPQAPAVPSAEESKALIDGWLEKNKPKKKAKKERTAAPSKDKPKKEKPQSKPGDLAPLKLKKEKKPASTKDDSTEELEETEDVEGVEEVEFDGEISAVPQLVNGQWRLVYDVQGVYMRDIGKYDLLTAEEERELLTRYLVHKDPIAWERLVACNQRLVIKVAKFYSRAYHVPLLDTVQEGNFGLMHAIKRFSLETGNKLSTYAVWWIKQAITRSIMDTNRTIRLPVHVHDLLSRSRKVSIKLFKKLGREPSVEELCAELGVTVKRLRNAEEGLKKIFSADCPIKASEVDGDLLIDFIADDRPLQDEQMHNQELSENVIGPALLALKPQYRFVMVMRVGLTGCIFTERDIAAAMKIKLEEVRELECVVLQKLNIPDSILFNREAAAEWLRHASRKALTPQEELVFILRYGIGAIESTLESIASRVSVTRERIRQIEEKSLPILRKRMEVGVLKNEKKLGIHRAASTETISAAKAVEGGIR